jgi:hypothetical protein
MKPNFCQEPSILLSSAIVQEIKNPRNEFISDKKEKSRTTRAAAIGARFAAGTLPADVFRYGLQLIVGKRKQFL